MGRRNKCEPQRRVVAVFTAQEVQGALYKAFPERFAGVPDQAHMWFTFVEDIGMSVSVIE